MMRPKVSSSDMDYVLETHWVIKINKNKYSFFLVFLKVIVAPV